MDKGIIRAGVNSKFAELLQERNASTASTRDKAFRRDVMIWACETFGITIPAAATHYNHSLQLFRKEHPQLVVGLGRPEDKKGGRKKKIVAEIAAIVNEIGGQNEETFAYTTVEPATFVVKKKKDGAIVAEGLSLTDAQDLVEKARAAKKASLIWE